MIGTSLNMLNQSIDSPIAELRQPELQQHDVGASVLMMDVVKRSDRIESDDKRVVVIAEHGVVSSASFYWISGLRCLLFQQLLLRAGSAVFRNDRGVGAGISSAPRDRPRREKSAEAT